MRKSLLNFVLAAVVPSLGFAVEPDWDLLAGEATAMLRDYIRVDTSNPPGNELAAARFLAERFTAEGIEHRIFESEPGRASIVARVPGSGGNKPIVLLSHLDTVGVDRAAWSHPTHGGEIVDGYMYGRGAIDCKGMAVVEAMSMIAIARSGQPLDRDIIFLATADEEKGGALGAGWFMENHADLLGGAEFVLNEGGHGRVLEDGTTVYEVGAVEKTPFWLKLTTNGEPGHGSTPRGVSSVARLVRALEKVRTMEQQIRVVPEVDAYYKALAPRQPERLRERYMNLAESLEDEGFREEFLGRSEDAALVRSTVSITVLSGSDKTNVVPARASAELDSRLLLDETPEKFLEKLRSTIDDKQVEIEVILNFPPSSSSTDTNLYRAIEAMAAGEGATVVPNVLRGFTDSHFFREVGITAYGFVPVVLTDEDIHRMHGADERIPVAELGTGTKRLVEILRGLDR